MDEYAPPREENESETPKLEVHHVVKDARDPKLNGEMTFKYPTAFEKIRIGRRFSQLVDNIPERSLPRETWLLANAISTLEFVIKTAPEGWYLPRESDATKPQLAPGRIGGGDEFLLIGATDAYEVWAETFRARAK